MNALALLNGETSVLLQILIIAIQIGLLAMITLLSINRSVRCQPGAVNRRWVITAYCMILLPLVHLICGFEIKVPRGAFVATSDRQDSFHGESISPSLRVESDAISLQNEGSEMMANEFSDPNSHASLIEGERNPIPGESTRSQLFQSDRLIANAASSLSNNPPVSFLAQTFPWIANHVQAILVGGYLLVCIVLLSRLLSGTFCLLRIIRHGRSIDCHRVREQFKNACERVALSRAPLLLESSEIRMPMAFGWRTPVVLVPTGFTTWASNEREAVLWHEIAHIARRDLVGELTARVLTIVYWIHPAALLVAARIRQSQELAADLHATEHGIKRGEYARALLAVIARIGTNGKNSLLPVSGMSAFGDIQSRVQSLLHSSKSESHRPRLYFIGFMMAISLMTSVKPYVSAESLSDANEIPVSNESPDAIAEPVDVDEPQQEKRASNDLISQVMHCKVTTLSGDAFHSILNVKGSVVDSKGMPAPDATVLLCEPAIVRNMLKVQEDPSFVWTPENHASLLFPTVLARATADSNGRFSFDNVKSPILELHANLIPNDQSYVILAAHPELGVQWKQLAPLSQKQIDAQVQLELIRTTTIEGVYVSEDKIPIAGAEICLESLRAPGSDLNQSKRDDLRFLGCYFCPKSKTDNQGRFQFTGVPVSMVAAVYANHTEKFCSSVANVATSPDAAKLESDASQDINVSNGKIESSPFTMIADPGKLLRIRVMDENGNGLPGIQTKINGFAFRFRTDTDGLIETRFPSPSLRMHLSDGAHPVAVFLFTDETSGLLQQKATFDRAQFLEETAELTVVLKRGTSVTGSLVDPLGRPIVGATILPWSSLIDFPVTAKTDSNGRFQFTLPTGTHQLLAYKDEPGWDLPCSDDLVGASEEERAAWQLDTINITNSDAIVIEPVIVERTKPLKISVAFQDGQQTPKARVIIRALKKVRDTIIVNEQGEFDWTPKGALGPETAFEAVAIDKERAYAGQCQLSQADDAFVRIVLAECAMIEGQVTLDGKPWEGVQVHAAESTPMKFVGGVFASTVGNFGSVYSTDEYGIYRIPVPVGKEMSISIARLPDNSQTPGTGRSAFTSAVSVHKVPDFTFVAGTQTIEGRVLDTEGNPIPNVQVYSPSNRESLWLGHTEVSQMKTDADGKFVLRKVPEGNHVLMFHPASQGQSPINIRQSIPAGERNAKVVISKKTANEPRRIAPVTIQKR